MKEIDDFVEELFIRNSNLRMVRKPESYDGAKKYILNRLNSKYDALISQGWESREALTKVLADFGADEGVMRAVAYEEMKASYEKFDRNYKKLQKIGFAGVIIWPIMFVSFLFTVESKITFLVIWVVYLILLAAYIITINYMDYRFKKKFKKEEELNK